MEIQNSTLADLDEILQMYKWATNLQRVYKVVPWPEFDRSITVRDIEEKRHWKLVSDDEIACIWTTTFSDPLIWAERNMDAAVYIHRVAAHPSFRGNNLVSNIVKWAIPYAKQNAKVFIRMDTVGKNDTLIRHYEKCGFSYLGLYQLKNTASLPDHYHNAVVSLFEIDLRKQQVQLS